MDQVKTVGPPSAGTVLGGIGALLGLIALVVSLSGSADASPSHRLIGRGDIAPGAVSSKALAKGAVKARNLAHGAVTSKALGKESVNRRILRKGAVSVASIAPGAVTEAAIAPGSVNGAALAARTIHTASITDLDQVASNPEWTASNTEAAMCGAGEVLLGTGFLFTEPGNKEVSWLRVEPLISGTGDGVSGGISSNSGGTAKAEVMALCLR